MVAEAVGVDVPVRIALEQAEADRARRRPHVDPAKPSGANRFSRFQKAMKYVPVMSRSFPLPIAGARPSELPTANSIGRPLTMPADALSPGSGAASRLSIEPTIGA